MKANIAQSKPWISFDTYVMMMMMMMMMMIEGLTYDGAHFNRFPG
jgi:hypothetical protein